MPLNFGGQKRSGAFDTVWPSARAIRTLGANDTNWEDAWGTPAGTYGIPAPLFWSRVPVFMVTRAPYLVTRAPVLVTQSRKKCYILNNFRVGTLKLPLKFALKLWAAAQLQGTEANKPDGNH